MRHAQLAAVLGAHALTLDPLTGAVAELEPFNAVMSKRGAEVERNLEMFEAEWGKAHPGEEPGLVVRARLRAKAWDHQRPNKKRPRSAARKAGGANWEMTDTPRICRGCNVLRWWCWRSCGCRRSRRVRSTGAQQVARRGRCTRWASTSRASSPSMVCKPPRERSGVRAARHAARGGGLLLRPPARRARKR